MKLEKLQKELETKIKDLILKVLKDFDTEYTVIKVFIDFNKCNIYIEHNNIIYHISYYKNVHIQIYSKNELINTRYCYENYKNYKAYYPNEVLQFIYSEPVEIIKTLNYNEELLETELKNILE